MKFAANRAPAARTKYRNQRTEIDGITFDSKAEASRYFTLRLLEKGGHIRDLKRQQSFDLTVNGFKIARYVADFTYYDLREQRQVVEDVKSKATMTPVYKLKRSLMRALHGVEIKEVMG